MKKTNQNARKSKSQEDQVAGRAIKKQYWLISIGVTVVFSGYNSFLALQSSIHVENGLGSKMTTISYIIQFSLNFLLVPFILRLIGARRSFILAEFSLVLYVIMNAFSNYYLLVIGAIAASFANAFCWVPIGISFVYFANKYHQFTSKSLEMCILEFSSIYFFVFQLNPIIGNLVSTAVLNLLNQSPSNLTQEVLSPTPTTENTTSVFELTSDHTQVTNWPAFNHADYCGANDCQDVSIIDESIDNYVPTNKVALYILSGVFVLFMLLGIMSHVILLPDMPFSDFNKRKSSSRSTSKKDEVDSSLEKKSLKMVFILSLEAVKDTFKQFLHPYQLFFITPYTTYLGFNLGFVLSEATRAYAACLLGVNQVGLCLTIFAACAALNNFMIGRFFGKGGRVPLLLFELVFDLSLYAFLLFWQPTESTAWMTYGLFGLLGVYSSSCQMLVANIYGCEFYKNKEISFNIWCIVFGIGFSLQYGISTMLCVREKIYICIVWIVLGVTLQIIFETKLKKKSLKEEINNEEKREEEKNSMTNKLEEI